MRAPQAVMVGMGGGGLHIERGVARGATRCPSLPPHSWSSSDGGVCRRNYYSEY